MTWWLKNDFRMIQTNIRDIDAKMDVDKLISKLKDMSADVLQINVGGISSFFTTKLEYQVPSPYLDGRDLVGEVVKKCHKNGIRVIGRFDFSKTHESLYPKHTEWYYKSAKGEIINYNDTVHTCPCGKYMQELSSEIIKEALEKYPLDGVFFNYFNFVTFDYSRNYYGICHCDSCKKQFMAFCGMELPEKEDHSKPSYAKYLEFKEYILSGILERIHKTVRQFGENIAISTYHAHNVDIIRNESNSSVLRPYPFMIYQSSMNVGTALGQYDKKIVSNCVINAAGIFNRFMGASKELTRIRLLENIASGSVLDFCIVGVFENYPDNDNFEYVKQVFDFHKQYKKYFGAMQSQAKIALVIETGFNQFFSDNKDYPGFLKILKEEHILYDIIGTEKILATSDSMKQYKAAIVPSLEGIPAKVIKEIRDQGVLLFVAGTTEKLSKEYSDALGYEVHGTLEDTKSAYLYAKDKKIFKHFVKRDWIFLMDRFGLVKEKSNKNLLPLVSKAWFGPPERAYGNSETDIPGALYIKDEKVVCFPWNVGKLYYMYGYEDHKHAFVDVLDNFVPEIRQFSTNAPISVETFFNKTKNGDYLLQLINLSGFNGTTVTKHIPIHDIEVTVPLSGNIEARSLKGNNIETKNSKKGTVIKISVLEEYEAVAIKAEK